MACNGRFLYDLFVTARWDYTWHVTVGSCVVGVLQQDGTICGINGSCMVRVLQQDGTICGM